MILARKFAVTKKLHVFGLILLGQLVSLIGSRLTGFALGVWVYQSTGSATKFALITFFSSVPGVLLSPLAGALVDRWDRRWIMLLSDAGAGVSTLTIWILLATGNLQVWHIYLLAAVNSACSAFQWPAYTATTTLLIPKQHFGRASGAIQLARAMGQIISPALGGMLVLVIGIEGVLMIDLLTFFFAIFTLLIVRVPQPEITEAGQEAKGTLRHEATYGWTYIKARPGLLGLLLFFAAINWSVSIASTLILPLVLNFANTATLGTVLAVSGSGMLAGGLVMSAWGGPKRRIHGIFAFTLVSGATLLLGGLQPSATLVAAAAFVFLFSAQIVGGCSQAIWQSKVEPDVQGRVFAVRRMVATATVPIALLAAGPLADYVFEPLLAVDGPLAGNVGQIIGTGPGRGIGLLFVMLGLLNLLAITIAYSHPRIRQVENELPDIVQDGMAASKDRSESIEKRRRIMKRVGKWLVRIGVVVLIVAIVAGGAGIWLVRRAWPQVEGTISVSGLQKEVKVLRDEWGVPHIYAQNEHDLFFAQGYVHAQDRLWQMEVNRRYTSGTLSAIAGRGKGASDRFIRILGLRRAAEKSWTEMDDNSRAIMEAYAEGVNAYIDTHRNRLPIEFTIVGHKPEPWTPIDSLVWGNQFAMFLGGNYSYELIRSDMTAQLGEEIMQQLFPPRAQDTPIIVLPEAKNYEGLHEAGIENLIAGFGLLGEPGPAWGSNEWSVDGSRTTSGGPLLANDTHLGLFMPSIWYEAGLHGGRFDVVGFTFPGVPMIVIGHNQDIAWGLASLGNDVQDFYLEKVDDLNNPTKYEYEGEWHDIKIVEETIEVRGGEPIKFDIRFTQHGPIVNDLLSNKEDYEHALTLRWVLHDGNKIFKAVEQVNLATNWHEFRQALQYWDAPGLDIIYADVEGNIGYQATGKTPIRAEGHQGLLPVPGWTSKYEWQGIIPFEEMPSAFDPSVGFLVAANNQVAPDDYPYILCLDWYPGYRAKRISDLLAASDQHTVEDMAQIQAQTYSLPAEELRPYLLSIEPENEIQAKALDLVEAWDLYFETDRVGASIYQTWYAFMLRNTIRDELGPAMGDEYLAGKYGRHGSQHVPLMVEWMADLDNPWFDDVSTPEMENRDDIIRRSLVDAINWLSERYGQDPQEWQWGRMHTAFFPHTLSGAGLLGKIFDSAPIAARGDNFTINEASFTWSQPFQVNHSTSQRMIIDLGDLDNSLAIVNTGQSGHLFHPHREDMIPLWQNVEYHPMLFTQQAVEANAKHVLILAPQD